MSRLRFCFEGLTAESNRSPYDPGTEPWQLHRRRTGAAGSRIDAAVADFVPAAGALRRPVPAAARGAHRGGAAAGHDRRRARLARASDRRLSLGADGRGGAPCRSAATIPLYARLAAAELRRWRDGEPRAHQRREALRPVEVIHGVDLEVEHGEFVVFVGPSGCGKSTLLRMIAGLEEITDGDDLHRRRAGQRGRRRQARPRHGVPVLRALPAHDGAQEPLLRARDHGRAQARRSQERVGEAARILQIEPLLDRRPGQLSGGQRQRVAIGRAIVREPKHLPVRRAAVQPRRGAARADAGRDRQAAPAARRDHDLRHPRPGRGHDAGRPHRGAARRAGSSRSARRSSSTTIPPTCSSPASSARPRMNFLEANDGRAAVRTGSRFAWATARL